MLCIYVYVCVYIHWYMYMYIYIRIYIYICVCVYMCIYDYMYIRIYTHVYTHTTHTHTHTQTHTHTHTKKKKHTHTRAHTHICRPIYPFNCYLCIHSLFMCIYLSIYMYISIHRCFYSPLICLCIINPKLPKPLCKPESPARPGASLAQPPRAP